MMLPILTIILSMMTLTLATTNVLEDLMRKHISMAMCQARCNNILDGSYGKDEVYSNVEHEYCSNICMMKRESKDSFSSMCAFTKICRTRPGCRVACMDDKNEVVEKEEVNEIVTIIKRYQLSQAILRLQGLRIEGRGEKKDKSKKNHIRNFEKKIKRGSKSLKKVIKKQELSKQTKFQSITSNASNFPKETQANSGDFPRNNNKSRHQNDMNNLSTQTNSG